MTVYHILLGVQYLKMYQIGLCTINALNAGLRFFVVVVFFFKKIFQELFKSVKLFGYRSVSIVYHFSLEGRTLGFMCGSRGGDRGSRPLLAYQKLYGFL